MNPNERRPLIETINRLIARYHRRALLTRGPRNGGFSMTDIAVGVTAVPVTWQVAIPDAAYSVQVSVVAGQAALGGLFAGLQAGSRQPTGCTILVKNTTAGVIAAASFDVLAFPTPAGG